jgi:ABC-type branched-subunit amino acid transport system ATPase component
MHKQMARTFQIPKLWKKLEVYSNLIIAAMNVFYAHYTFQFLFKFLTMHCLIRSYPVTH